MYKSQPPRQQNSEMEAKESKDALAAAVPTAAIEKPEKPVAAEEVLDGGCMII